MNNVFWIGVYPGLTAEMLDFIAATISAFVSACASEADKSVFPISQ
jgi:CDP-6-deoxy-D-xylo-4-hexulose-3-dehydrase